MQIRKTALTVDLGTLSFGSLAKLQSTLPLICMSLNKNNVYCDMPRSSKPPDTCKWGVPNRQGFLRVLQQFPLNCFLEDENR